MARSSNSKAVNNEQCRNEFGEQDCYRDHGHDHKATRFGSPPLAPLRELALHERCKASCCNRIHQRQWSNCWRLIRSWGVNKNPGRTDCKAFVTFAIAAATCFPRRAAKIQQSQGWLELDQEVGPLAGPVQLEPPPTQP